MGKQLFTMLTSENWIQTETIAGQTEWGTLQQSFLHRQGTLEIKKILSTQDQFNSITPCLMNRMSHEANLSSKGKTT